MKDRVGLTGSATLARGTMWNLAGRVGPLLVALVATPFLVESLGLARWGIFALALSLTAIFASLDLGLGRALTRVVAQHLGDGTADSARAGEAVMTGLALLFLLGLGAGLAAAVGAHAYVSALPDLSAALAHEVGLALMLLGAAAPLVLVNAALWGVLAAHQRFAAANLVNMPVLALYYLGPLAVLQVWDSLIAAVIVLVACRAAMTWAYWRICVAAMPSLGGARPRAAMAGVLLRQGGWITLSNLLWPLSQQVDRFIIGIRLSAEATALYATPFDVVSRLGVLSQAVVASAFPAMATALAGAPDAVGRLFRHSALGIAAMLLPACILSVLLAEELLTAWLGAGFAAGAAASMRWIAAGVLVAALDSLTIALLDGAGRSRRNALLAVAELAVYLPVLLALLAGFGIAGAAIAWTLRALAVAGVRLVLALQVVPALRGELRRLALPAAATALAMAVAMGGTEVALAERLVLALALPLPALWFGWRHGLLPEERRAVVARIAALRGASG